MINESRVTGTRRFAKQQRNDPTIFDEEVCI